MASLVGDAVSAGRSIHIACTTLDQLPQRLLPPGLIKVDAEGAELDVLGGRYLLAEVRPRLIVEFTTRELLDQALQLLPSLTLCSSTKTSGCFDSSDE